MRWGRTVAQFHVSASVVRKRTAPGSSREMAAYMARMETERGVQAARYLARTGGHEKDDLVARGAHRLPHWARGDDLAFWAAADRYERGGEIRAGVIARHYQFTLPRELSPEGRLALAEDIRMAFFDRHPHTWAVHNPPARDGTGDNPHLHVLFSPRRDDGDRALDAPTWFSQQADGARKVRMWDEKRTLQGVRYESAILINAALDREACAAAVSSLALRDRGHDRRGVHYAQFGPDVATIARVQEQQSVLRRDYHPFEGEVTRAAWWEQKTRERIDVDRQAVLDQVRDRFWIRDTSPTREAQRAESLERFIERQYQRTGREHLAVPVREVEHQQVVWERELADLNHTGWSGLGLDDEWRGQGVRVRLEMQGRER